MREINITSANVSKAAKRLKKALEKKLGQKISLAESSELFAQSLGAQNTHQLMQ